ncbi:MAG: NFACT RNA binding domain-containing protein [bacterium]|nr:NFACT RNA binding domain-containing protein [bacterium]
MHHNYYFLKHLSNQLNSKLEGFELVEAFSQSKDELVLSFLKEREEFHIKATLDSQYAMLSFPGEFARAKRNSIDLFPELILNTVNSVTQFKNERSFSIDFSNGYSLIFKMHGKRSNILLFQNNDLIRLFNNQMKYDLGVTIDSLHRPIDQSIESFEKEGITNTYPTFDKKIHLELRRRGFEETEVNKSYNIIKGLINDMVPPFYLYEEKGLPYLSLFKTAQTPLFESSDPITISNELFYRFTRVFSLKREKETAISKVQNQIKKGNNYISKSSKKLDEIKHSSRNEEIANIIMANLHQIQEGSNSADLFDFYNESEITIKLKSNLSPQKNAENYYRKAKNQKIEIKNLEDNIEKKSEEVLNLEVELDQLKNIDKLKALRKKVEELKLNQKTGVKGDTLPYRKLNVNGWDLYVGKSAKSNDELTLKHTHKDDLWLHAKDVSGSHVVLKQNPGQKVPNDVLEKSAQIAAYYSKRKTDSLCPVIFTPKKYVRKPKGSAPGLVIVDREEVIMVQPASPEEVLNSEF